jgi:hypothetical protein
MKKANWEVEETCFPLITIVVDGLFSDVYVLRSRFRGNAPGRARRFASRLEENLTSL